MLPGASLAHSASPGGATYGGRRRVESKPSVCDQLTIARPIRRPRSSEADLVEADTPAAARARSRESASRTTAARVVGRPSRSIESSTTRSALTAVSVGSYECRESGAGSTGNRLRRPLSGGSPLPVCDRPEYNPLAAYMSRRDATGGDSRSTRLTPDIARIQTHILLGSVG